jgi:hypothetical protein
LDPLHFQDTPSGAVLHQISLYGYETGQALDIVETDAWVERQLDGSTLTISIATYPRIIEETGINISTFPEQSKRDPNANIVLRVTADVNPIDYAKAGEATFHWWATDGTPLEQIKQEIADEINWPMVFGRLRGVTAKITVRPPQ